MATYLKLRSDIEVEVRYNLTDPTDYGSTPDGSDARWDRASVLFWFNKGVVDIRRKRPQSKLSGRYVIPYLAYSVTKHTADSYTILEDTYSNMIVNFMCWKMLAEDDVDEHSATRAKEFRAQYYGGI